MSGLDNEKAVELLLQIELIRMKGFSATSIGIAFFIVTQMCLSRGDFIIVVHPAEIDPMGCYDLGGHNGSLQADHKSLMETLSTCQTQTVFWVCCEIGGALLPHHRIRVLPSDYKQ